MKAAEKNLEINEEELLGTKEVEDYKKSVVSLKNKGIMKIHFLSTKNQ